MGAWEANGKSDEWYTPQFIFDAMTCTFDLDVANAAIGGAHVPCRQSFGSEGLEREWQGFVWMNPPFGGRNQKSPWLDKFFAHGNGVALTPDRTSAPWWQEAAAKADAILFINGKPKFERPDGSVGKQPGNGVSLMASGQNGVYALRVAHANGLGFLTEKRI